MWFTTYNINKTDFISLIQKARQYGIISQNLGLTWQTVRFITYHHFIIFDKISASYTESSIVLSTSTSI